MAPEWVVAVIIPFIVAVFLTVGAFASSLSGWSALGRAYPVTMELDGERFRFASASFRWLADYNGCLTMMVSEEGLRIQLMPLFFFLRLGHPPLFLPWAEMTITRGRNFWYGEHVCLRMEQEPKLPIRLRARLANRLQQAAGSNWPEETPSSDKKEMA